MDRFRRDEALRQSGKMVVMSDEDLRQLLLQPNLPANAEGISTTPQAVIVSVTSLCAFAAEHGLAQSRLEPRLDTYIESIGGERLKLVNLDKLAGRAFRRLTGQAPRRTNTDQYYVPVTHVAERFASRPPAPLPHH